MFLKWDTSKRQKALASILINRVKIICRMNPWSESFILCSSSRENVEIPLTLQVPSGSLWSVSLPICSG
jgi:hypothetical protein